MKEQQRRLALIAELDELRGFTRPFGGDRAVIANESAGAPLNVQMAANGLLIELTLELKEVRAVGNPRNDFAHVVGLFRIVRDQSQQLVDRVEGFFPLPFGQPLQLLVP
ncbi:hypothetical protein D3C84_928910 [compost metagenome]